MAPRWPRAGSTALTLALVLLLLNARCAASLKLTVHPLATECVNEYVSEEHFLVQGGPRIEGALFVSDKHGAVPAVTVLLYSPSGELMWSQAHVQAEAHFNVAARGPGSYRICFQSHSRVDTLVDLVYFTLGHLRRPGQVNVPKGTQESRGKEMARRDHLEDVKRNVLVVGELVDILGGEQRYLQRKLDRHIQTCRSNNRRALWYTVLEVAALAAAGAVNVLAVSGMFKNGPSGSRFVGRIAV